jgi:XTP/dITP diphosphohydrolase
MPRQLVFATHNAHKVEEVRRILEGTGIEVRSLADLDIQEDPPETGDTFEANALQKARFILAHTGLPCVADDSGLEVDALDGAPGVHSKRYTPEATADSNNAKLLRELDGIETRAARFRCVLALVGPDGEATASGACEGHILEAPSGAGGFGYDPVFAPSEAPGRSMAELSADEKNAISHRGRAFRQLPALLAQLEGAS